MKKKNKQNVTSTYGAKPSSISMPAEANFNFAVSLFQNKNLADAKKLLKELLSINSKHAESWFLFALIADEELLPQDAINYLEIALKIDPNNLKYIYTLGDIYYANEYLIEGVKLFESIIIASPNDHNAYYNLAAFQQKQKKYDKSLESYHKVLELDENNVNAIYNIGNILIDTKDYFNAVEYFKRVIEFQPNSDDALNNIGYIKLELGQLEAAYEYLYKAILINPENFIALNNLGKACDKLFRYSEALQFFKKTIEINPNYAEAYANLAIMLTGLKHYNEALEAYKSAFKLRLDYDYLRGCEFQTNMNNCNWSNFYYKLKKLLSDIMLCKKVSPSFPVLALTDSLSIQLECSKIWVNDKYPINLFCDEIKKIKNNDNKKILIGYYSADFHNHATSYLMAELFEKHDKSKFEIIAFSFGPDLIDDMRHRIKYAFDQFVDVSFKSDSSVAALSRQMGINIAVDLKGCTEGERMGIFSYRAAPIQINYIGFPGTLAAPYFDYIVADKTLIPKQYQQYYTEKVVYLPNSYQVNDSKRQISDKVFTKEESGLPKEGFVFCCFNNNYKITPHTFDGWVRILKGVEGSVLWLLVDNPTAKLNLRNEAEARGLNPNRLIFANRLKLPEHLARHRVADLFIDTLPYNAHTTASDALWAGLPVLTCMGESFASRVAASLLNAIELPELITTSQAEYEAKAIELANNPAKLKAIKDKLERNRLTTALFDTSRYTKHIEAAYMKMYERYQADLLPDHIYIDAQ